MEVVVTTGGISCAKLQSNRHQQINAQLFKGQMTFLSPDQRCRIIKAKFAFDNGQICVNLR